MNRTLRSLKGGALLALIVLAIGAIVMAVGESAQIRVVNFFFINMIIVLGLQVTMGNSGVVNLGHISFMGIGAYAAAVLAIPVAIKTVTHPTAPWGLESFALSPLLAGVVGVALSTFLAWLSGLVLTRQSGIAASIATLALLVIVHTVLSNWTDVTRGLVAIYGIPMVSNIVMLMFITAGVVIVVRLFRDSKMGVQLRASGQDVLAASSMGVNVRRLRLIAWVLGSAIISLAGVLYAYLIGTMSPKSFYFEAVFLTLAMLILGGMRSVSGAVIGSIVVTIGFELMRYLENGPEIFGLDLPEMFGLTGFFLGAIIVLFMALRPSGLVGDEELDELMARRRRERKERAAGSGATASS